MVSYDLLLNRLTGYFRLDIDNTKITASNPAKISLLQNFINSISLIGREGSNNVPPATCYAID